QPLKESQELLIRHLTTKDPTLFAKIAQSLGKVGDQRALERLEVTTPPDEKVARRTLESAKTLLSYRLRLNKHLLPTPSDADLVKVTDGIPSKIQTANPA